MTDEDGYYIVSVIYVSYGGDTKYGFNYTHTLSPEIYWRAKKGQGESRDMIKEYSKSCLRKSLREKGYPLDLDWEEKWVDGQFYYSKGTDELLPW